MTKMEGWIKSDGDFIKKSKKEREEKERLMRRKKDGKRK